MELITQSNIIFVLGILGIIFTVYNYFKNPQEELEKRQSLSEKEVANKDTLLTQQLQWEKEANERRFKELNDALCASENLVENHIHAVDVKLDNLTNIVNKMNVELTNKITELSTIISNRIPKN